MTGVDLLADLSAFFRVLSGVVDGFAERARAVDRLLGDPATTFLIVTSPEPAPVEEAIFFRRRLAEAGMPFGGLIVNRVRVLARPPNPRSTSVSSPRISAEMVSSPPGPCGRCGTCAHSPSAMPPACGRLAAELDDEHPILVPQLGREVSDVAGLVTVERFLFAIDAYWRAANYLSVGQIYLLDNPLLRRPLSAEDVKPRLLGHWGTTPGLNFIYAHLNQLICRRDLSAIYVTGPGHGGPGLVANAYLEGTYSEVYPHIGQDETGMRRLFRQFSFPGGIPSHVAPETPGSIHEGGELGYSLVHAYGAAFDNPDLLVACVIGDGEAETGPLAASWHSNKFLNPARDGAVLPILHLNGYKIANPTVLARIPHDELQALLEGYGHDPIFVEGHDPETMHRLMADALARCMDRIAQIQQVARETGSLSGRAGR